MFFGISMSPTGWFITFMFAILLVFMPFLLVQDMTRDLAEPYRTISIVLICYMVFPAIVSYLYYLKIRKTGKGSIIFWIYCGVFTLLFIMTFAQLFTKDMSVESVMGPVITGIVSFLMIRFAYKTKSALIEDIEAYEKTTYEAQREEDIRRQAEAIVLAEKIKNEKNQT